MDGEWSRGDGEFDGDGDVLVEDVVQICDTR